MILRIFNGDNASRWKNHPATGMWVGYEYSLKIYALSMCQEWIYRGYKDTIVPEIMDFPFEYGPYPNWLGDPKVHISHQSNLVRKLPEHYEVFFPDVPNDLPYYWPTKH